MGWGGPDGIVTVAPIWGVVAVGAPVQVATDVLMVEDDDEEGDDGHEEVHQNVGVDVDVRHVLEVENVEVDVDPAEKLDEVDVVDNKVVEEVVDVVDELVVDDELPVDESVAVAATASSSSAARAIRWASASSAARR